MELIGLNLSVQFHFSTAVEILLKIGKLKIQDFDRNFCKLSVLKTIIAVLQDDDKSTIIPCIFSRHLLTCHCAGRPCGRKLDCSVTNSTLLARGRCFQRVAQQFPQRAEILSCRSVLAILVAGEVHRVIPTSNDWSLGLCSFEFGHSFYGISYLCTEQTKMTW